MKHFLKAYAKEVCRTYEWNHDLETQFEDMTNMNIVPKVELSIVELLTKA